MMQNNTLKCLILAVLMTSACLMTLNTQAYAAPASCAIFEENDIKQYALAHWDENNDGCIDAQEADHVMEIPIFAFPKKSLKTLNDLKQFRNLDTIGESAFRGCKDLTVIDLPQVKHIGDNAFTDTAAYIIKLPNVVDIGQEAFFSTRPNVTKPKVTYRFPKLKKLGRSAFANIIPQAPAEATYIMATDIPIGAFLNNRLIAKFEYANNSSQLDSRNDLSIGISAFQNSTIKKFTLSGGYISIAREAFANSNLATFAGPREPGLYERPGLPGSRLSDGSIQHLGDGAFRDSQLSKLDFFIDLGALSSVNCNGNDTPFCTGSDVFEGTDLKIIYIEAPMARGGVTQNEVFDNVDTEEIILRVPMALKKQIELEAGSFLGKEWKTIQYIR